MTKSDSGKQELNGVSASSPSIVEKIKQEFIQFPSTVRNFFKTGGDAYFKLFTAIIACNIFVILIIMLYKLIQIAAPSIAEFGFGFLWGRAWKPYPVKPEDPPTFGALPAIWGTLVSSGIALLIAVPLSVMIGLALSEFAPKRFTYGVSFLVELLAAIPSVVYGLWGIFILIPFLTQYVYPFLQNTLGFLPLFQGAIRGPSVLTGSIVLSIMILPTISAISRDVFAAVPQHQREAIIALGATRWETARLVMGYGRSGMIGAVVLGLGRAVGETMAVTMLIGNAFNMFSSLFAPGYTLASLIANEFTEASSPPIYLSALIEIGLVLFLLALIVNIMARLLVWHSMRLVRGTTRI